MSAKTPPEWLGINKPDSLTEQGLAIRRALADAAKAFDWARVDSILDEHPDLVNSTRPGGSSLFTPLHQAAFAGASKAVAQRLAARGAFRTIHNVLGERPLDVAERRGHQHLLSVLEPVYRHEVPFGILQKVQSHFHDVIRGRADQLVQEHTLRLPELEPLLELDEPKMWFTVPGMYGGFHYWLEDFGVRCRLVTESWCRVVGGSGQRHEITTAGSRLVEEGFV